MYRVAEEQSADQNSPAPSKYLRRAYGTAIALFVVPMEIERWSAYRTGLYNERVIVDLIADLKPKACPPS
jgi:hypothetical protein